VMRMDEIEEMNVELVNSDDATTRTYRNELPIRRLARQIR